jgi:hypothetical protein
MSRPCYKCQTILPVGNYNECSFLRNLCYKCYCLDYATSSTYVDIDEETLEYKRVSDYSILFADKYLKRQAQLKKRTVLGTLFHPELKAMLNDKDFSKKVRKIMLYAQENDIKVVDEILIKKCEECKRDLRSDKDGRNIDYIHNFSGGDPVRHYSMCHYCYTESRAKRYIEERDLQTMFVMDMKMYFTHMDGIKKGETFSGYQEAYDILDTEKYPEIYKAMKLIRADYNKATKLVKDWGTDFWPKIKDCFVESKLYKKWDCPNPNFTISNDYEFTVTDYLGGVFISVNRKRDRYYLTLEINRRGTISWTGTNGSVKDIEETFDSITLNEEPARKKQKISK